LDRAVGPEHDLRIEKGNSKIKYNTRKTAFSFLSIMSTPGKDTGEELKH
jgi:hypothetical protein